MTAAAKRSVERHFVSVCVGVMTTCLATIAIGGGIWAMQIRDAVRAIPIMQADLAELREGQQTVADQLAAMRAAESEWAARLQIHNVGLKIPDPRDPSRLLGP